MAKAEIVLGEVGHFKLELNIGDTQNITLSNNAATLTVDANHLAIVIMVRNNNNYDPACSYNNTGISSKIYTNVSNYRAAVFIIPDVKAGDVITLTNNVVNAQYFYLDQKEE